MRIKLSVLILCIICLNLFGCSRINKSNVIKEDLQNYVNEQLPTLEELENKVTDGYNSISGDNYTDDKTMYFALRDEIIPASLELIEAAEDIIPETENVREVHEIYISAINTQHSAFSIILSAIENQDYAKVSEANEKLSAARKGERDFQSELDELIEKYN